MVVDTPAGPAVQFHAGPAAALAAALGRVLPTVPPDTEVARALVRARALLLEVEARQLAGSGFAAETEGGRSVLDELVTAEVASRVIGISPQGVRKRCRLGAIPGARQVGGRWLIPQDVLPAPEADGDQAA